MKRSLKLYDYVLEGYLVNTESDVKEVVTQVVWGEVESTVQTIAHVEYISTVNNVSIYYCYDTDDYLFADTAY